MILSVKNNPDQLKAGEFIVFFTGKKKSAEYPKYMRIGEVVIGYGNGIEDNGSSFKVKEVSTGKIWFPYTRDCIRVGEGVIVKGVKSCIELTDNI